jgi:tRNA threonylcarbamoyl adenosine modification protein (Sua5/YciO/YrdC/YwlC family)
MLIKVYPKAPAPRHIQQIAETLEKGGVVILPTDSVYCFAASAHSPEGMKKLAALKGVPLHKSSFSYMFADLSRLGEYTRHVSNKAFKMMNRLLPGPFTFILAASADMEPRKTVGIRVVDNSIPREVIKSLNCPLVTTSVYDEDEILEYTTDPDVIAHRFEGKVDLIVNGGFGHNEASTVVDCSNGEITVLRKGMGVLMEEV